MKDWTITQEQAREIKAEGLAVCNFCLKDVPPDDERWGTWTDERGRVVYVVCGWCANQEARV